MDSLTWNELTERQGNPCISNQRTKGDILHLDISTVPGNLQNLAQLVKEEVEHRKQRGQL